MSNFVGPLLARREALFVVLFVSHVAALAGAVALLVLEGGAWLDDERLAYAGLAGLGNAIGLIGFYKAAELGPLSVAAPIGATGATVPVVWGLTNGDVLTAAQAAGHGAGAGGLRARGAAHRRRRPRPTAIRERARCGRPARRSRSGCS